MTGTEKIAASFKAADRALDLPMLRNEIENAVALALTDLTHEMVCLQEEIPGLLGWPAGEYPSPWQLGRLMASCMEAGRRYGLLSAIAYCTPEIIYPDPPSPEAVRQRYGNVSTFEQARRIAEFDYAFNEAMLASIRAPQEADTISGSTLRRLHRLETDEPLLFAALREAVLGAAATTGESRRAATRGTCASKASLQ